MTDLSSQLDGLADPTQFQGSIDISHISEEIALRCLKKMMLIRAVEEKIASRVRDGTVYTPCHLASGQEAIAVGIAESLTEHDRIYSGHRSHAHYLSLTDEIDPLINEIFCNREGLSGGHGGSQHLSNESIGFGGSVPIVAGTIPLALGAAFSFKRQKTQNIAVTYFGDGATEEGGFHECMNLAKMLNLPVVFVCENNLYSSHLDIKLRQPSDKLARFAVAHGIDNHVVDGNDVGAVYKTASVAFGNVRNGSGPVFIEAVTYRHAGHVGGNSDIDVGVRRSKNELSNWMNRCPIKRLSETLINQNILSEKGLTQIKGEHERLVSDAIRRAALISEPS